MKTIKTLSKYLAIFLIVLTSCINDEKKESNNPSDQNTTDDLHLSFKTPDWERKINCDKLDLYPSEINDSTSTVLASSTSTNETFCFSYPRDSSKIVKSKISKTHKNNDNL